MKKISKTCWSLLLTISLVGASFAGLIHPAYATGTQALDSKTYTAHWSGADYPKASYQISEKGNTAKTVAAYSLSSKKQTPTADAVYKKYAFTYDKVRQLQTAPNHDAYLAYQKEDLWANVSKILLAGYQADSYGYANELGFKSSDLSTAFYTATQFSLWAVTDAADKATAYSSSRDKLRNIANTSNHPEMLKLFDKVLGNNQAENLHHYTIPNNVSFDLYVPEDTRYPVLVAALSSKPATNMVPFVLKNFKVNDVIKSHTTYMIVADDHTGYVMHTFKTDQTGSYDSSGQNFKLTAPASYLLRESDSTHADMPFTVDANGTITFTNLSVNTNDTTPITKTTIFVKKTDPDGKALAGAKLVLSDAQGKQLDSWVSNDSPRMVSLAAGDYIVHEDAAPNGYLSTSDTRFTVEANGELKLAANNSSAANAQGNTLTIINKKVPTPVANTTDKKDVIINKLGSGNKALAGAKLTLKDANGNKIDSWTSGNTGRSLKLAAGTYTLHEDAAPKGYVAVSDVQFKVDANGQLSIVKKGAKDTVTVNKNTLNVTDLTTAKAAAANKKSVKTGDNSQLALYAVLLLASAGALLYFVARRKSHK